MKEQAINFGPAARLAGIVCEPDAGQSHINAPAVIVSNIGFHHRTAPFRLWVDLSRRLAALGFTTLRFDTSGLGDSAARQDNQADSQVADTREAMAWLTERKKRGSFILLGLCSGTDAAHALATTDARVVGAIFIDGYTYPTLKSRIIHHPLMRLFSHRHWSRLFRRIRLGVSRSEMESDEIFVRDYPTRERMTRDVEAMLGRGTKLLYVYTNDVEYMYNYTDQFYDMLALPQLRGRIALERYPEADHLFSLPDQRQRLQDRIAVFMSSHWSR